MSDKLGKKNKRRERKLSEAIDAGREFRKAIRSLTSVGFDESYIEGFEARLTFDIRVLKKERDRLHGDDIADTAAEPPASATQATAEDEARPAEPAEEVKPADPAEEVRPAAPAEEAKLAGPRRARRPRKAPAPVDEPT
jgi:hypothetical protein